MDDSFTVGRLSRLLMAVAALATASTSGVDAQDTFPPMAEGQIPSPIGRSMLKGYPEGYSPGPSLSDLYGPETPPSSTTPTPAPDPGFQPSYSPDLFASTGGDGFAIADAGGYIESAVPRTRFRLVYDAAFGLNNPDRAEFFYPACGCFRLFGNDFTARGPTQGLPNLLRVGRDQVRVVPFPRNPDGSIMRNPDGTVMFPQGTGPNMLIAGGSEPNIDFQELTPSFEYAPLPNFSVFAEIPTRYLNPTLVPNFAGFSDVRLGFKYAFVARPDRFYTFQTRFFIPTGKGEHGLGTDHTSIEPGLLVFQQLTDRLFFLGEFRNWIPIGASDFGGNVLRYGAGLSYNIVETRRMRISPVMEYVGWTVLGGKKSNIDPNGPPVLDANGDTIVNGKFGVRIGFGEYDRAGGGSVLNDRHSIYVGYGRALTGDHWYQDIFRLDYQFYF